LKKFVWRLQKLLDIKIKQEDVLRRELVAITQQAVSIRGQIMMQRAMLRQMLADLAEKKPHQRVIEQERFFKYSHVNDEIIKKLEANLAKIEEIRKAKVQEIMEHRKSRKGLEKLRIQAKAEFTAQQLRFEQKESDDKTTTRFARKIIQQT